MTTARLPERILKGMKKPVDAILDWLWDRLTNLVMNQGQVTPAPDQHAARTTKVTRPRGTA